MPSSTLTNLSHLYTGQVLCVHQCVLHPVPPLPLLADTASRGLPGPGRPRRSCSTQRRSNCWTGGLRTTWWSWSTLHKPDLSGGVIEEAGVQLQKLISEVYTASLSGLLYICSGLLYIRSGPFPRLKLQPDWSKNLCNLMKYIRVYITLVWLHSWEGSELNPRNFSTHLLVNRSH